VPVVALNVPEVPPAPTVTEAGTFNVAFVSERATTAPPVEADWLRVTVHVPEAFEPRLAGLHETAETDTDGATRLTVVLAELLLYVAVMVALELLLMAAVVTMRLTDVAAAATVTEGATVSAVLEFERVTLAPPEGAGWVRVILQMLEAFEPRLVGLHETAETVTEEATRLTVAVEELLL